MLTLLNDQQALTRELEKAFASFGEKKYVSKVVEQCLRKLKGYLENVPKDFDQTLSALLEMVDDKTVEPEKRNAALLYTLMRDGAKELMDTYTNVYLHMLSAKAEQKDTAIRSTFAFQDRRGARDGELSALTPSAIESEEKKDLGYAVGRDLNLSDDELEEQLGGRTLLRAITDNPQFEKGSYTTRAKEDNPQVKLFRKKDIPFVASASGSISATSSSCSTATSPRARRLRSGCWRRSSCSWSVADTTASSRGLSLIHI